MFIQDRAAARRMFVEAWRKHRERLPMEPLEEMLAAVVTQHPEYHEFLSQAEEALAEEFAPERGLTNPFLHMGMHIAIREQVSTDRPVGIAALYRGLLTRFASAHDLEHRMMECLGEALWRAGRENRLPDEAAYLDCLRRI